MSHQVFTIGHSTHSLDHFLALLAEHRIKTLVDIRRFPGSRKFPQFNADALAAALKAAGVDYLWFEALGGRRTRMKDAAPSLNVGLENKSFRNYADYMLTEQFRLEMDRLLEVARRQRVAIMCAEGLYWRCHRRLVSDFLFAHAIAVRHIMPSGELKPHALTAGARITEGNLSYPGEDSLFSGQD